MVERIDVFPTHEYEGYKFAAGKPFPFGATSVPGGVNFSIYSAPATRVRWCCSIRGKRSRGLRFPFREDSALATFGP